MKKKIYTMQDIANEAGVSKATVSYVLNNKKGHRISESTQKKILQIANLYNYIPNMSAKFLSKDNFKLIGILIGNNDKLTKAQTFNFLSYLQKNLIEYGYRPVLINYKEKFDYLDLAYDAIVALNFDDEKLTNITNATFAPIILVDIIFDKSPLFFYIYNNYGSAFRLVYDHIESKTKLTLVYNKFNNKHLNDYIESNKYITNIYCYENTNDYLEFLDKHKDEYFIVMNEFLGSMAEHVLSNNNFVVICENTPTLLQKDTKYIYFSDKQKSDTLTPLMFNLINKNENIYDKSHRIELDYVGHNLEISN